MSTRMPPVALGAAAGVARARDPDPFRPDRDGDAVAALRAVTRLEAQLADGGGFDQRFVRIDRQDRSFEEGSRHR